MEDEALSSLAREIIKAGSYDQLVIKGDTPPQAIQLLGVVTPEQLLAAPIVSYGHACAMLAGLWLWHGGLTECHEIAQADPQTMHRTALNLHSKASKTGQSVPLMQSVESDNDRLQRELARAMTSLSFWHAIMHRLEGDFSNAKYWYARCETHRCMRLLGAVATDVVGKEAAKDPGVLRVVAGEWNAEALVDLAAAVHNKPGDVRFTAAVRLQQIEWRTLFHHCVNKAVGAPE